MEPWQIILIVVFLYEKIIDTVYIMENNSYENI